MTATCSSGRRPRGRLDGEAREAGHARLLPPIPSRGHRWSLSVGPGTRPAAVCGPPGGAPGLCQQVTPSTWRSGRRSMEGLDVKVFSSSGRRRKHSRVPRASEEVDRKLSRRSRVSDLLPTEPPSRHAPWWGWTSDFTVTTAQIWGVAMGHALDLCHRQAYLRNEPTELVSSEPRVQLTSLSSHKDFSEHLLIARHCPRDGREV